jgi:OOP family OmpA-OmpF porin
MRKLACLLLVAGMAPVGGPSFASDGYVGNSTPNMTRTGYGECLHTERWSEANAIAECDPEIVAARDAKSVAAMEVIVVKEMKPVQLEADTLFDFDKAVLTEDGKARLTSLLDGLTAADLNEQKIQITGHADRIGDDAYNIGLSQRRAAAVRDYLVSSGVVPTFIETTGVGASQPVVECENIRGAALIECLAPNRRTEIEFSAVEVIEIEKTVPVQKQNP